VDAVFQFSQLILKIAVHQANSFELYQPFHQKLIFEIKINSYEQLHRKKRESQKRTDSSRYGNSY